MWKTSFPACWSSLLFFFFMDLQQSKFKGWMSQQKFSRDFIFLFFFPRPRLAAIIHLQLFHILTLNWWLTAHVISACQLCILWWLCLWTVVPFLSNWSVCVRFDWVAIYLSTLLPPGNGISLHLVWLVISSYCFIDMPPVKGWQCSCCRFLHIGGCHMQWVLTDSLKQWNIPGTADGWDP